MNTTVIGMFFFVFFFSSRRRHTRYPLVTGVQTLCSSDLPQYDEAQQAYLTAAGTAVQLRGQIGRASCRERGEISVGAVSLKKKKTKNRLILVERVTHVANYGLDTDTKTAE